jgi:hypothetical protein
MILISIDRDMLISELYKVLSFLNEENSEENIKKQTMYLIDVITNAPLNEKKSNYPKINIRRG